ncbi:thiopurine S-methyltransferase [Paraferrimonas sedimenticola]|uniref:Thiopurine S-methyltransferase n=1 Tax=Paraferrimonas sedimenticola TaxID=375674 RepID=A0AA37RXL8_9GAMM|nr:thiopurine S-methyltransferase [Paraferrimonas sedimenticola]GLP97294.1 thiopurine S-methyltransferase [Paraferrimonas sedimenticola]
MQAEFWHQRWSKQQIGFHLPGVNPLLEQYWPRLGASKDARVFVPLCGKSLDMGYLMATQASVVGCELSQTAVEQFFDEAGLAVECTIKGEHQSYQAQNIELIQGDIYTLEQASIGDCDAFYDRAALIAWPESMRADYARQLASLLPSGSRGMLITLDYPQAQMDGPPFSVPQCWVEQYLGEHFDIELVSETDVLQDNPKFLKKGVERLSETVYFLTRK